MKQFQKIQDKLKRLSDYINNDITDDIGKEAVDHFKENFQKEGFVNARLKKWKPAKRKSDDNAKGTAKTRKTLTGETGDLAKSIHYEATAKTVTIISDAPYAKIHNEGGKAGRGLKTKIPKRPFIGVSKKLEKNINTAIKQEIKKRLK